MVHGPAAIYELVSFFYYRICFCHHCIHGYRRRCRSAVIFNGFSDIPLATAQGTNLLFFLPVGAVALLFHKKSGLLQVKKGAACGLWGLPGVFLGVWIASRLESTILSKLFALFLFYLGLKTLFSKNVKNPRKKGNTSSGDDS